MVDGEGLRGRHFDPGALPTNGDESTDFAESLHLRVVETT